MNVVLLMGRLTADPDIRVTQDGKMTIAKYTLAVDKWGKEDADFLPCVAFGKAAEFAEKHLHKGTKIAVEGRLQSERFTDRQGNNRMFYTVVVGQHHFCESKKQEPVADTDNAKFMQVPDDPGLPWN